MASVLWLVPLVGFVAVAVGYLSQQVWWPSAALISAAVSLALMVLWWGGLNVSSAFLAGAFNVVVIGAVLWQRHLGAATL